MTRLTRGAALGAALATAVAAPMTAASAAPAATVLHTQDARPGVAAAQRNADSTRTALGLPASEKLTVRNVVTDANGTTHVRYDRSFNGLRVIGGDFIVTRDKAGKTRQVHWNGTGKVSVASTSPKLSKASAETTGARRSQARAEKSTGELVVFAGSGSPRLAYDVVTTGIKADQTPTRLHTIVDASSGSVLTSYDEVETGTGNSMYSGQVPLNTTSSGSTWQLKDSHGNYTTDLNGATSGNGTLFTDADNIWGSGSASSRQTAGVDAEYGAEKTFDYYKNVQGRNGIWNNGTGARSRVHYGNGYNNAFWDGTQMSYGDGSGNTHPLTEIDVAGHEMSHGVTENSAGLAYTGDAGGLNEATSDIFGTGVEWYANSSVDKPDYLIGEQINLNGNGTPLRYMDKPSRDGSSPDCWSSNTKNLDPHYSSGALNHWYYLASEGSGAKTVNGVSYNSPTCDGSTVTGAGHAVAEKVWYRTLTTKLTSNSTYQDARDGAIASAKELYGAGSAQCQSVEAAMKAINAPAGSQACGGSTPPPPTGGNLLQNPGFESGAVSWTGTSGPITNDTGRPAHSGSWKMWLGGNGRTASESEAQTVTVPAAATAATLSFWVRIDTAESGGTAYDTMKPQVVSGGVTTTLATYSNANANSSWVQKSFDLSSYRGKSVTVQFVMSEDASLQTSFVVDDTAVTTS